MCSLGNATWKSICPKVNIFFCIFFGGLIVHPWKESRPRDVHEEQIETWLFCSCEVTEKLCNILLLSLFSFDLLIFLYNYM